MNGSLSDTSQPCVEVPSANAMAARGQGRKGTKTIAVLADFISSINDGYEGRLRLALHSQCQRHGVNLLLVYGRALNDTNPMHATHNSIFGFISERSVDGVIAISSLLAGICGVEKLATYLQRFAHLPLCSFGVAIPGVPSVTVDTRPGLERMLEHLIREHGFRRLAFMGGLPDHPDSRLRHEIFRSTLERLGVEYDPRLLTHGRFIRDGGHAAILELIARGLPVDAVVCANDAMAVGVLDALRRVGTLVPRDIAITGFDDLMYARLGNPTLTTIGQPLEAMVEIALNLVLRQIDGEVVETEVKLPTHFVTRRSCGCKAPGFGRISVPYSPNSRDLSAYLQQHRAELVSRLAAQLGMRCVGALDKCMRLVDGIEAEASGESDAFAEALDGVLAEFGNEGERILELNGAINELRSALSGHLGREFEAVWYGASQRIISACSTALFNQRLDLDYSYMHLVGTAEQVSVAFDLTSFEQMLLQHLPHAGVTSTYISRFVDDQKTELEPFVRIYDGQISKSPVCRYPAAQLLPPGAYPPDVRYSVVVFPLTCEIQCLGIAIFEYTEKLVGYHLLRDQTSLALQSVLLHSKVVETTLLHERSVQERLAATQRTQALRALAGGVAHDLNNVMGPLMALPDVMLRELAALEIAPEEIRQLVADVESIKTSSRHAVQTIKDLLTLGRNGRTPKVPLDLNATISSWLGLDSTRANLRANRVQIEIDLYPGLLTVVASEAHLLRAVMNLVRNALDALDNDGQITIRTYPFSTRVPHLGFESIPAGDYVAISVSDDGKGLPESAKARLFEPFFSTKRVGEQCGTGLGLAVVHGVVKEHDGFIDFNSRIGFGTTFTLYFPQSNERITTKASSHLPRYRQGKILLVDDDPVQRRTGQRVLSHFGYDVDALSSGEDACRRFEEAAAPGPCPYDLLILDMQLGGELDGIAVLERVRTRFPSQQAIMVTGQVPAEKVERAILQDIPWLQKPYSMDDLGHAVFQVLSGQASVPVVRASTVRP